MGRSGTARWVIGAAVLCAVVAGCAPGGADGPAAAQAAASDVPFDPETLRPGDRIPAGQAYLARAAGKPVFTTANTDPGVVVVFSPDEPLPQAIKDEIASETDPMKRLGIVYPLSKAGMRMIVLSRARFSTGLTYSFMITDPDPLDAGMGWTADYNPITVQGIGFMTHEEAMAFIEPWLEGYPGQFLDLTQ
ncbi:hypothetical protein [Xylanimonas ulmi]|uniref:Lipoprotein n=1 Tax=Xylanimonas ulmi TaxID=228973 RepID=A0A4Q7M764_9MICO|nr:hypothetical protein [Xylanibacterium ulmi]RZS62478.1 hypothetical protein EV386_2814 [Xylanibacterium ulmi]